MADEARPLSRRERREMEEQAAAGLAPVPVASSAPSAAPGAGLDAVDASGLSRRDRRRLERLEQPMETWTAVEEAHHTGQVPTMTPEVIAQQEELARRRAAEAQADALASTGGIHRVTPQQVTAAAISRYDMPDEAPEASVPDPRAPRREARATTRAGGSPRPPPRPRRSSR